MNEEEKVKIISFLKELGLADQVINPILKLLDSSSASVITKESLNKQLDLLKHSISRLWDSMPTICSLSAMLLIIATFNPNLIAVGFSVKLILTVLLAIIPLGIWLNFIDAIRGQESSLVSMLKTVEKSNMSEIEKKDIKDMMTKAKKPTLKGQLPFYIHCIFTVAIVLLIFLIWRIDLIELVISII
ncbi:MAG: hypothetical protein WC428_07350 [Candidatus Paceibacterota bacterium]|jgi:hypothetical protein